jgi:hypothetical protein
MTGTTATMITANIKEFHRSHNDTKPRVCLRCGLSFKSLGPFNRICRGCENAPIPSIRVCKTRIP